MRGGWRAAAVRNRRSRRLFDTTKTELKAIAAPAMRATPMSKQASPPPPGDRPAPAAPPRSPGWRHWLLPVREFGLSAVLGPVGYPEGGSVFLGGGGGPGLSSRPLAEATQAAIDAEVARLLREAEGRATGLLRAHSGQLGQLTELLLDQETVDGAAVYQIAGRPAPAEPGAGATMAPRRAAAAGPAARPAASAGASAAVPATGATPRALEPEGGKP